MTLARMDDRGDRAVVMNMNVDRRGALSADLYQAIRDAFALAEEPRIRSVILTAEGGFFCAGGDLNVLISRRDLPEMERREKVDELHDLVRMIRACPVPVIAAVEGGAAGAGASLALACDFIIAAEGAKFTAAYVKAGLVPDAGLTSALSRLVPRPLAMEMCVLARPVTAERLHNMGAVTEVVAPGHVDDAVNVLADAIARGPRQAQATIRRLVSDAYEATEAQQLDAERDAMAAASGGSEAAEGIAAVLEKRSPPLGSCTALVPCY